MSLRDRQQDINKWDTGMCIGPARCLTSMLCDRYQVTLLTFWTTIRGTSALYLNHLNFKLYIAPNFRMFILIFSYYSNQEAVE